MGILVRFLMYPDIISNFQSSRIHPTVQRPLLLHHIHMLHPSYLIAHGTALASPCAPVLSLPCHYFLSSELSEHGLLAEQTEHSSRFLSL